MLNACWQSKVKHSTSFSRDFTLALGAQRLLAIKGETQNCVKLFCFTLMGAQRLSAIKGETRRAWEYRLRVLFLVILQAPLRKTQ